MRNIILFSACLVFFLSGFLQAKEITLQGNNLSWSPMDDEKFIFAFYGKKSGNLIWRMYDLAANTEDTIYYGDSIKPEWTTDGNTIFFAQKNKFILYNNSKEEEIDSLAAAITGFDLNLQADKIIYSDNSKLYLLNLKDKKNSVIGAGQDPQFFNNDGMVLFFNQDLQVNVLNVNDEPLSAKVVLTNMIKKIIVYKKSDKFLFSDNNNICLYDLSKGKFTVLVNSDINIIDYSLLEEKNYLTYNNMQGDHYVLHIPSKLKARIYSNKDYLSQKLSCSGRFAAFEKNGQILINDISESLKNISPDNLIKISLGIKDGVTPETSFEIYEEKANPFTQKVIGYEPAEFKGVVKVVSVYENYCYCLQDKENSTDKAIEQGDVALWKEKNITGTVEK